MKTGPRYAAPFQHMKTGFSNVCGPLSGSLSRVAELSDGSLIEWWLPMLCFFNAETPPTAKLGILSWFHSSHL